MTESSSSSCSRIAIKERLDQFVEERGNGVYVYEPITKVNPNPNSTEYGVGGSFDNPIQQSRNEIYTLIDVLLGVSPRDVYVETGAGEWIGSHFLMQPLFNKIITIEMTQSVIDKISYPTTEKDIFIISDSRQALDELKKHTDKIDVLLLDSMHVYGVVSEEYKLYAPMVREGGLIIFHDALSPLFPDMQEFMKQVENGFLDGIKHKVNYIDDSPGTKIGIGWFVK